MLSLHYNGDNSYLFDAQWTTSESEKTGVYGKIYDFVVDYEQIVGAKAIYDMHRYLMTKHNISSQ